MKTWTVYFELFGKKMKTDIEADSFYAAQLKVKDKIVFHKTVEKSAAACEHKINELFKDIFEHLK